ncbi:extracellular solute-binding protein [Arthrobacter sp. 35W]|uniref:extracellular solute-binding protein n=1 Tax=Arthrobacter sp. 35W TaxID=1132441 RepID=UPI0003F69CE9|nr:extracellular solute-binding protein [Arthrobacter sp. 35W]
MMTIPKTRGTARILTAAAALSVAALALTGCGGSGTGGTDTAVEAGSGEGTINVWAVDGQAAENDALQKIISNFESSQSKIKVDLKLFPSDQYTKAVNSAAPGDLPDVLDFDGPTLASFVYNGKMAPLEGFVSEETLSNQTDSIKAQNTVDNAVYGVGMMNAGLALWGNKHLLDAAGVAYPTTPEKAWTADEFTGVLDKLAAVVPGGKPLDLSEQYGFAGEWGTCCSAGPVIWSGGGTMLKDNKASGALDSEANVKALTTFASWKKYADPNADGLAFTNGRVALSWVGHWTYPTYKALGADLVSIPLPNFGKGTKTASGTFAWGMGAKSKNGSAAGKFLDFLMTDQSVHTYTDANGAPPATKTALASSSLYGPGKQLALLGDQLGKACGTEDKITDSCVSVTRPVTAGYPIVTDQVGKAEAAIYAGKDAKEALSAAARAIDQNFADNDGYKK